MRGLFITFEGGEGSGKTTQIARLGAKLEDAGFPVTVTREPGGTPGAEKIRDLIVQRDSENWPPASEILLLFAARLTHIENCIKPALEAGHCVICDRFTDSTYAYQGYGHHQGTDLIDLMQDTVMNRFEPDLTLLLDIDAETGLKRAGRRIQRTQSSEDRFEQLGLTFHERIRQGYLERAALAPNRIKIIDATRDILKISDEIARIVFERLGS